MDLRKREREEVSQNGNPGREKYRRVPIKPTFAGERKAQRRKRITRSATERKEGQTSERSPEHRETVEVCHPARSIRPPTPWGKGKRNVEIGGRKVEL